MTYITVGELAQRAGVSPRTIKYWEEKGIFQAETRTEGGFRLYPEIYVLFCDLVRDLQNFGYKLEEIKDVADMFRRFYAVSRNPEDFSADEVLEDLTRMQEAIDALKKRMELLKAGIRRWEAYAAEKSAEIRRLSLLFRKGGDRKD